MPFVKTFTVQDGIIGSERMPEEPDQLYATPEELGALFGMRVSEAQIRHAQQLINSHTNRPSLFPCEIVEPKIRIPSDRLETRLAVCPVIRILEAGGRFAYSYRRDRQGLNATVYGAVALMALQGVVPRITPINVDLLQVEPQTGIVALPMGALLMPYNELLVRYVSGFVDIPARVKTALAQIINNVSSKGVSDRIAYNVGRISRRYATASFITKDEEDLLRPFVVTSLA